MRNRVNSLWATATLSFLMLMVVFAAASVFLNSNDFIIVAFSFLPLLIIGAIGFYNNEEGVFGPIGLLLLTTALGTTVRTMYIVLSPDYYSAIHLMDGESNEILYLGLLSISVFLFCLAFSYTYTRKKANIKLYSKIYSEKKYDFATFFLFSIGCISTLIFVFDLGLAGLQEQLSMKRNVQVSGAMFSADSGYLTWFSSFSTVALLLYTAKLSLKIRKGVNPTKSWLIFFFMLLVSSAVPFLSGSRAGIVNIIIICTMIFAYKKININFGKMVAVITVCVTVLFLMSVLRVSAQQRIGFTDALSQFEVADVYRSTVGNRHFLGVAKTSLTVDRVPSNAEYNGLSSFVNWVYLPVPRFMWADKPDLRIGKIFGYNVLGGAESNGTPPGLTAELFYSGGWAFLVIGGMLMGVVMKKLLFFERELRNGDHIHHLIITIGVFCICFKMIGSDFAGGVIDFLKYTIPLLIIRNFVTVNR